MPCEEDMPPLSTCLSVAKVIDKLRLNLLFDDGSEPREAALKENPVAEQHYLASLNALEAARIHMKLAAIALKEV
jgi:hypothetical protein